METLPTDWADGDTVHATDLNAIDAEINSLEDIYALGNTMRPLQGTTAAITSAQINGENATGVVSVGTWDVSAGKWRYCGVVPVPVSGVPAYCNNMNNGYGTSSGSLPIVLEFWSNATEIHLYGYWYSKPDCWALVDDKRIRDDWEHWNNADGAGTWKLTQGSAIWRKWRLCLGGGNFKQLLANTGALFAPTTSLPHGQVAYIGDSYVSGVGIANAVSAGVTGNVLAGSPAGELEQITGWDIWRCSVPGTGYINDAGGSGPSAYGSVSRMAAFAALPSLDLILIQSSVNDTAVGGYSGPTATVTAAENLWTAIKTARPNTPLVVLGLEATAAASTPNTDLNNALKAVAIQHTGVSAFVDLRAHAIITGTGKDGSTTGDGNADYFLAADGAHLTHMGDRHYAEHLARRLRPVAVNTPLA